jgi:hypothetical protein
MDTRFLKVAALTCASVRLLSAVAGVAQENPQNSRSGDEVNYQQTRQRGAQAVIWGIPLVAMQAFRESAMRVLGATYNDVIIMSEPPAPRQSFLTPTNETPYEMLMLNTGDGPVVVEIPPASKTTLFFGTIADAWQLPLSDVGPQGADAGKGGKYLFLPPGYKGDVPTGYFVFRANTTHLYAALRPVSINGGTLAQAVEYEHTLKTYPLTQATAPPPNRYIEA